MQLFANNADSSLNGAIASDTLVLTLKTGEGSKFPSPSNGDYFLVTIFQKIGTTELNHEIVKCTSRAGDNLTVVRAQEGTSAKSFNSGDLVELRFTKGSADNLVQKVTGKDLSTEDYTTAEKSKLAGVAAGAQVNSVTSVAGKTGAVALVKADVGLGSVDNTSDANKPVSTATQTALNGKEGTIAAGTAAQFWRGDKTWADFATTVRASILTGLSTATNAVVAATDTVLTAIGKLQAQVSEKFDKAGGDINGPVGVAGLLTVKSPSAGVAGKISFQNSFGGADLQIGKSDVIANWAEIFHAASGGVLNISQSGAGTVNTLVNNTVVQEVTTAGVRVISGSLGYGVGSGGAVVQATSKSTAVTLNKPSGQITMHSESLASGASVSFVFNNSFLGANDGMLIRPSGFTGYAVEIEYSLSATSVVVRVTNRGATRSDPLALLFQLVKGAAS